MRINFLFLLVSTNFEQIFTLSMQLHQFLQIKNIDSVLLINVKNVWRDEIWALLPRLTKLETSKVNMYVIETKQYSRFILSKSDSFELRWTNMQ